MIKRVLIEKQQRGKPRKLSADCQNKDKRMMSITEINVKKKLIGEPGSTTVFPTTYMHRQEEDG